MRFNPISDEHLLNIFKKSSRNSALIGTNEGVTIEYKQSFGWKSIPEYLRAMAAFANRDGGYLIFGIQDKPHLLLGLDDATLKNFEKRDNGEWTTLIREYFAPEINWNKRTFLFESKTYGIIYTYPAINKPVICKKSSDNLRKAAIYYRYNSQNTEIDYPELLKIIESEKQKINELWINKMHEIANIGVSRLALLDLKNGNLSGKNTTLFIDEPLLNQMKFVQEGSFVETGGTPALKVVGEVKTVVGARSIIVEKSQIKAINSDEIIRSFIVQEKINNPMEYVRQICYQSSGNLPVYFYLNEAKKNCEEALNFLDEIPIKSQSKEILKRRIRDKEIKFSNLVVCNTPASLTKQRFYQSIIEETCIIPSEEKELKYFFSSVRGLEKDNIVSHKEYLLNMFFDIYTKYYNLQEYASIKQDFRYALCWIDEALYMELINTYEKKEVE